MMAAASIPIRPARSLTVKDQESSPCGLGLDNGLSALAAPAVFLGSFSALGLAASHFHRRSKAIFLGFRNSKVYFIRRFAASELCPFAVWPARLIFKGLLPFSGFGSGFFKLQIAN